MTRTLGLALLLVVAAGCKKKESALQVQTVPVERRDIVVEAEATGVVEPINVVEVKSKASGQIVRMPVETGSIVRPGDLLVQVDTRDVQNQYNQSLADVRAAEARNQISQAQRKRSVELFAQGIITAQEHEASALDHANAEAALVRARTNLDLAQQRLEDATVRAPIAGTVIDKDVSLGQVITSATGAFGGGTTLLKMADLGRVRIRALVNETDIGQVRAGQSARVTVDAYPDRPFQGVVEKIEPQAVVQQSVTMFPVLVSIGNQEGLLKPGMNGEVAVLIDRRENVLAVPNDAVRNPREAVALAPALGLDADSVQAQLQRQLASLGSPGPDGPERMRGGRMGGPPSGDRPMMIAHGAVDLDAGQQQNPRQGAEQQGPRQMGERPTATEAECTAARAALDRKPALRARLDSTRQRLASGAIAREEAMATFRAIYGELGLDLRVARACLGRPIRLETPSGAEAERQGPPDASSGRGASPQRREGARRADAAGAPATAGGPRGGRGQRARPALVFVGEAGKFQPRVVRVGISNYDYTEVLGGVVEGETVAMLSAAAMQTQRNEATQRIRERTGGGMPGMQRQQSGGGAGGAGGAGGGGAGGGGGQRRGGGG